MLVMTMQKKMSHLFSGVSTRYGGIVQIIRFRLQQIQQTPNDQRGLYMFFIELGSSKYPINMGVTSRNFRQRFLEHHNSPNGVIHKFIDGNFPQNIPPHLRSQLLLKVKCIPLSYSMQAKLMESVFLAAFDFCLNTEENDHTRVNIDATSNLQLHNPSPTSKLQLTM